MMRTVSRPLCSLRSAMTTEAPSAASAMAVARPIPEPPPVMRATLPLGSMGCSLRLGGAAVVVWRIVGSFASIDLSRWNFGAGWWAKRAPAVFASIQPEGLDLVRVGAVEAAGRRRTRLPHVRPLGGVEEDGHEVLASKMSQGA